MFLLLLLCSACVSDRRLIQANLGTFRLKPKHARYVLFFFIRKNGTKTEQCFVYHCSVFLYHCPVFALLFLFFTTEQKRNSVFCTTVSCFRNTVPFFALHFRFFPQRNKNGTVYFVPMFRVFVPLFRFCTTVSFLHYCSVFCTTVPFFHNGTKTEQFVFVPLFRLFCTSVPFSHNRTKTEQCILYHCSVFLYHCSVFCTTVPFFPQRNKNGTVYFVPLFRVFVPLFRFCTTVPFFFTSVPFFLQQNKNNSVFCTTVPCLCTTVLFFHYCSIFPQIEGTSYSVS